MSKNRGFTRRRRGWAMADALEPRRMLSAATFEASLAATRAALTGYGAGGVTIISHGYEAADDGGDELLPLAQAVQGVEGGILVNVNAAGGGTFSTSVAAGGSSHVTLLYDWAPESNEAAAGFAEGAGDSLFGMLVGLGLVSPQGDVKSVGSLHFIGEGSGAVVTSEAVERLASYGVAVDQVTYLDPHDFNAPGDSTDDGQLLSTDGLPLGYGAAVWSNVGFADTYYQTRAAPVGRPIPGAYNETIGSGTAEAAYLATVLNSGTAQDGYAYAERPGSRPTGSAADNFYGAKQDHTYSNPNLVSLELTSSGATRWVANATGLSRLHLTEDAVAAGGWSPGYLRGTIYNGFFDLAGASGRIPGWVDNGGESAGVAQNGAGEGSAIEAISHAITYIPGAVHGLEYELKVLTPGAGDLVVRIGDVEIDRVALGSDRSAEAGSNGFERRVATIPASLIGSAHAISFSVEGAGADTSATFLVDGVRFGNPDGVSVVPVIDHSGSMAGQKLDDAKTASSLFVQLLSDDDRVGVVSFDSDATTNFSLTQVTIGPPDTRTAAADAIALISSGSSTAIGKGLLAASDQLQTVTGSRAIVLLTDGEENVAPYVDAVLPQLPADIRIYTIGLGSDADENLLIDIAQRTGGRYEFGATPADLQRIYSEILADVTGAQTLTRSSSTIAAGATVSGTVSVSPGTTSASFGINWEDSDLDLSLVSPDGTVYSAATLGTLPNAQRVQGATYEVLKITSPLAGMWTTRVTAAADSGTEGTPFDLYAFGATTKQVNLSTGVQALATGSVARLTVTAADEFGAVRGGTISAMVTDPDSATQPLAFSDDGSGADLVAGDGVYTAEYRALNAAGVYSISASFSATDNSGEALSRTLATTFRATGSDLSGARPVVLVNGAAVDAESGGYVSLGSYSGGAQRPSATFTIRNEGTAPYTLTRVSLPAGFSLTQGGGSMTLAPGQEATLTIQLDATGEGTQSGQVTLISGSGEQTFGVLGINTPGKLSVTAGGTAVTTVDLGSARIHSHGASTVVTLTNTGGSSIPLKIQLPDGFTAINVPSMLAAGATAEVTISVPASAAGTVSGDAVIQRTDTSATLLTVPLTATVTNGPLAVVSGVTATTKASYLTADKKAGGTVTAVIENTGNLPLSGDVTLTVELVGDSGTFNVGTKTVKAKNLAVGKSIKAKVPAKFSGVTVSGEYDLQAVIHGVGALDPAYAEGSAGSVELKPTTVKLLVSPPLGVIAKGTLVVPLGMNNEGNVSATGDLLADVVLLPEGMSDASQGLVLARGLKLKSNVKAGGSGTVMVKVKLPATVAAGGYTAVVTLSGSGLAASDVQIQPAEVRVGVTVG